MRLDLPRWQLTWWLTTSSARAPNLFGNCKNGLSKRLAPTNDPSGLSSSWNFRKLQQGSYSGLNYANSKRKIDVATKHCVDVLESGNAHETRLRRTGTSRLVFILGVRLRG